jgi:hypothetical protein
MRLAFDIETLGLLHETPLPEITCVCFHCVADDGATTTGATSAVQLRLWGLPPEERAANVRRIIALLDEAEAIGGFNAILFDLEFVRRALDIDADRALRWVRKCVDPYMVARFVLGEGCGMNAMLALNGHASKTGSGGDAIRMAREGEWPALLGYCYMDAKLTYDLCAHEWLRLTPGVECRLDWGRSPPRFRLRASPSSSTPATPCVVGSADALWRATPTLSLLLPESIGDHHLQPEENE